MISTSQTLAANSNSTVRDRRNEHRRQLLGTWQMISWTVEDLISGEKSPALGENPKGCITYSPEGRVTVLVLRGDRKKPAALVPTDAEKVALYDSMFAYAGTYSSDGEKVLHNIDMSWNESWTGTTQIRFLKLQGDELTYVSEPARNPMNSRDCVHTVVFRRIAPG
jgi:hypothetical protein